MTTRQILATSGVVAPPGGEPPPSLIPHAITLAGTADRTRLCLIATATGDSPQLIQQFHERFARPGIDVSHLALFPQPNVADIRAHLLSQDVIWVGGGSVVNLMAVWRAHGLPDVLRECWEAGVVLGGGSAGSLCWHLGGPTDSFRDELDPFTDGLGWLPYSNGVHDDLADQPRRETFRRMVADGTFPAGYATEDGVGLHYIGDRLHETVTVVPGKRAWWVEGDAEQPITPRAVDGSVPAAPAGSDGDGAG
jgi:peptidase E